LFLFGVPSLPNSNVTGSVILLPQLASPGMLGQC
jgi:hypothetical protein